MATLQKFKIFASQCTVMSSPTRSPSTSPVIQLRRPRRRTLAMLLRGRSSPPRQVGDDYQMMLTRQKSNNRNAISNSLADLFVSSPPNPKCEPHQVSCKGETGFAFFSSVMNGVKGGNAGHGNVPGSPRPVSVGFRNRLIRRAWRPILDTVHEAPDQHGVNDEIELSR